MKVKIIVILVGNLYTYLLVSSTWVKHKLHAAGDDYEVVEDAETNKMK